MIRIANVLCPIDFSEFSRRALDYAAALARWYESKLTVLHVVPNLPVMDLPPLVLEPGDRERLLSEMRQWTSRLPGQVPVDLKLQEAPDIHREILAQAGVLQADLLVMGSHGRSGFERFLIGSVTDKVLRKAPCPVLVVPKAAHDVAPDKPPRFRRILCPVDFSEGSIDALTYALSVAEEADAQLTLLHVIELPPELQEFPLSAALDVSAVRAAAEAERAKRLQQLIPDEARSYCTVDTGVSEGAAYREILKGASEGAADLIVMGVHGRGTVGGMVFGSNAARVTRAATCPVMVIGKRR